MLKKFAEDLKDARLKSGVSIQQIHNKTRIDIKFLEAIENGNFEILPEVYLRAFIRGYANSVGLDEAQVMKKYEAAKSGKMIEENVIEDNITEAHKESSQKVFTGAEQHNVANMDGTSAKQFSLNPKVLLIFVVVAALGLAVYFIFFNSSSSEIITERPYEEMLAENNKRFESSETDSTKTSVPQTFSTSDSLVLLIKAKDTSWIDVKKDDNTVGTDFLLYNSNQRIVKAEKSFTITVGNSKGVEFILNNKPLNFSGSYRERKIVKIDSTGLSYLPVFRTEQKKND